MHALGVACCDVILSHWQSSMYGLPLVKLVEDAVGKYSVSTNSVINFGCGAGLTAFLLSNTFKKVKTAT